MMDLFTMLLMKGIEIPFFLFNSTQFFSFNRNIINQRIKNKRRNIYRLFLLLEKWRLIKMTQSRWKSIPNILGPSFPALRHARTSRVPPVTREVQACACVCTTRGLRSFCSSLPPPFPSARRTKDERQDRGNFILYTDTRHPWFNSFLSLLFPLSSNFFPTSFFFFSCILSHLLYFSFSERESFMDDLFYFHCFSFLNLSLESKSEKWGRFLFVEN